MENQNSEAVKKAVEARDKFLRENPHLQKFQDELDQLLEKTPPEYRMETLSLMMTGKLLELQTHLITVAGTLNDAFRASM